MVQCTYQYKAPGDMGKRQEFDQFSFPLSEAFDNLSALG